MPKYLVQVNYTESYLYAVDAPDAAEAKRRARAAYLDDPEPVMEDGELSTTIRVEMTDGEKDEEVLR